MPKTICICDRCGKEVEVRLAKRIVFKPALSPEETSESKLVEMITKVFKNPLQDFCPECVTEIKEFMDSKKSKLDKEASANESG